MPDSLLPPLQEKTRTGALPAQRLFLGVLAAFFIAAAVAPFGKNPAEPKKEDAQSADNPKEEPNAAAAEPAEPKKEDGKSEEKPIKEAPKEAPNQQAPNKEEPKVEIRAALPVLQIRPAQLKDAKAGQNLLGAKEQKILQHLQKMSPDQVREMAEVYARLGNRLMAATLVAELERRMPNDAAVLTLQKEITEMQLIPDDPEALLAQEKLLQGKPVEAAALLSKLKAEKYRGRPFRYQQDLAYAYLESGQRDLAEEAFRELTVSSIAEKEEKVDAQKSLSRMALDALLNKGDGALNARDARRVMQVANELLAKDPEDPDGVSLKAAAYSLQGNPQAGVDFLMEKKIAGRDAFFRHQKALADAFYDARQFDSAQEAYEAVIRDKRYSAEDRRDSMARLKDLVRDRLLAEGEKALLDKKFAEAERIANELELRWPGNRYVRGFRASIHSRQRRFSEAVKLLEELKNNPQPGEPFTSHGDLAEAYAHTGNWRGAAENYAVVEEDPRENAVWRFDAARMRRDMLARYRPTIVGAFETQDEAEGRYYSATHEFSSGVVGGKNIFLIRTAADEVALASSRLIKEVDSSRWQAEVAYRRLISHGFFGEVSVGGSDDEAVYGAHVGKYEGPGMAYGLIFRGNDRATDSLHLAALNGRQDSVTLYVGSHFSRNFYLDARVFLRQVKVDGHDLGEGWGMETTLGYTLLEETARRPEMALTYFNEISHFNSNRLPANFLHNKLRPGATDLESALIDSRINRHGLLLSFSKKLTPRVNAFIYGGLSYEFEYRELEARFGAGLEAYLSKNSSFWLGLDYSTSGNVGNRGADVWSANAGFRVSW